MENTIIKFKELYYLDVILNGAMSSELHSIFLKLTSEFNLSNNDMDDIINEVKIKHGVSDKTDEQLKIEELESKLNEILDNI